MSLFHKHTWEEVEVKYIPAIEVETLKADSYQALLEMEKLMAGYTVIKLRCSGCRDVASREIKGRWELNV